MTAIQGTSRRCWAYHLGDCQGNLSREHVISDSISEQNEFVVQGIAAMGGVVRLVSASSLTAKVLCRRHNSRLSPLDEEAAKIAKAIRGARIEQSPSEIEADGGMLERWALKILVNLLSAKWAVKDAIHPGQSIVEQVFGLQSIQSPSGLYVLSGCKGSGGLDETYWAPIIVRNPHVQVLGLFLVFEGFIMALSTCRSDLRDVVRDQSPFGHFDTSQVETHYRPPQIQFGSPGSHNPLVTLRLKWP